MIWIAVYVFLVALIVVVFLYAYGVWCNMQIAALEQKLMEDFLAVNDLKVKLIEERENLRLELNSKILENLELKNSLLELTLTKAENNWVLLIVGVIFVAITIGVLIHINKSHPFIDPTGGAAENTVKAFRDRVESPKDFCSTVESLEARLLYNSECIKNLQAQDFETFNLLCRLNGKIDELDLTLRLITRINSAQQYVDLGVGALDAFSSLS